MMKTNQPPHLKRSVNLWALLLLGSTLVLVWNMQMPNIEPVRPPEPVRSTDSDEPTKGRLGLRTFRVSSGWGYAIYAGNQLLIHQPYIPALPGSQGFGTHQKARKAGQWVMRKIRRGATPPSVTLRELDSLEVLD